MLYRRGASGAQKRAPLKKIAAVDSALLSLAGVSPDWKINLRTGGRRWLGQRLRERSERWLETRNAQKKVRMPSTADDLHFRAVRQSELFVRASNQTALDVEVASSS
jgi:hypothetical protein